MNEALAHLEAVQARARNIQSTKDFTAWRRELRAAERAERASRLGAKEFRARAIQFIDSGGITPAWIVEGFRRDGRCRGFDETDLVGLIAREVTQRWAAPRGQFYLQAHRTLERRALEALRALAQEGKVQVNDRGWWRLIEGEQQGQP